MPVGQPSPSTVVTSQPYFIYQPYPGYTYQQPQQLQFGLVNRSFLGGYNIPNANPIPSYPRYPPLGAGLITQGFRDPNRQLPFISTLDLLDLSHLTNDPINHLPF